MNKNKTQKGITLIALIITIIIMLILVAVTVTIAINGGLFGMAKDAKSKTENELAKENTLSTGRVEIDNVWYDSMEDYINGNKSANKGNGQERPETVAGLKAGQYVNYVYEKKDGTQETIPCMVLYDDAYNTEHGTEYGIQIITADVVDEMEITLTRENWENPETLLYEKAQSYLNTSLASMSRCVGSDPGAPEEIGGKGVIYVDSDDGMSESMYFEPKSVIDLAQLSVVCADSLGSKYWLFQPYFYGGSPDSYYIGLIIYPDGAYSENLLYNNWYSFPDDDWNIYHISSGFRPCFKLKPGVKVIDGSGTELDPYQLEIPE